MEEKALVDFLESAQFIKASTNASRLVAKLKAAIQKQEFYEAHQILGTIYFRFINVKEKVFALENLLYRGACYLLEQNEHISGQDLATLFLEAAAKCLQYHRDDGNEKAKLDLSNPSLAYHINEKTLDLDISQKISNLATAMPDTALGQPKFLAAAFRIVSPKLLNRNLLHFSLANRFWRIKDFVKCRYHYLHCASLENANAIADLLITYQSSSACKSEVDLFITQFILQFICMQSPLDSLKTPNQKSTPVTLQTARMTRGTIRSIAEKVFATYVQKHPSLSLSHLPYSQFPLLNFTYFIISILDGNQEARAFKMLRDTYKVTWSRDPNYESYLNRIGAVYFGVVDQTSQRQGGFFNNILLSLLDGNDEDDEDSNPEEADSSWCDILD